MTVINSSSVTKQEFGQRVPDFSLSPLDGDGVRTLPDYLAGKMGAAIVFWSAICTHCFRYDEYFNSFSGLHPQLGFVAIASRYGETCEQMHEAVKRRRLRFPILVDPSGAVARAWHSQQTPRSYLVDREGHLVYRGAIDNFKFSKDPEYAAYLEPVIESHLAGKRIARAETASFGCAIETSYYHLPKQL
jgi:peroxiredoxin